jgi:hypothetical protein
MYLIYVQTQLYSEARKIPRLSVLAAIHACNLSSVQLYMHGELPLRVHRVRASCLV